MKAPVWDLPTRLFHWSLVALLGFSWWSAENAPIAWHFWSGYGVCALLLFRLMWGLVGSSTARFSGFVRGPRALAAYLRDMKGWAGVGHSPLGALSVLALLAVLLVQVATGLIQLDSEDFIEGPLSTLVSFAVAEAAHDWHEISFTALQVLVVLHVAAILFYRLVLGKKLIGPMIGGRSELPEGARPMRAGNWWAAALCLLLALAITRWIIAGAPPLPVNSDWVIECFV